MSRAQSWEGQREHVVQLLRDRKNGIGGYVAGIKDFAEMGAPGNESWPLSAEQIKRGFGTPDRRDERHPDDVPQYDWIISASRRSHAILEREVEWLRDNAPHLAQAVESIFPMDDAGDRDYERLVSLARAGNARARAQSDRLRDMVYDAKRLRMKGKVLEAAILMGRVREENRRALAGRGRVERCDAGIDVITGRLLGEDLIAEFATRMTRMEEEAMEETNARILDEYYELLSRGGSKKVHRGTITKKYGISDSTLYRIEQNRREEMGLPARTPGRPKKGEE